MKCKKSETPNDEAMVTTAETTVETIQTEETQAQAQTEETVAEQQAQTPTAATKAQAQAKATGTVTFRIIDIMKK